MLDLLKRLWHGDRPKSAPPMTHDYSKCGVGHNINYLGESRFGKGGIDVCGWGFGIRPDDRIFWRGQLYRVITIGYTFDPRDMWFAEIRPVPRMEREA